MHTHRNQNLQYRLYMLLPTLTRGHLRHHRRQCPLCLVLRIRQHPIDHNRLHRHNTRSNSNSRNSSSNIDDKVQSRTRPAVAVLVTALLLLPATSMAPAPAWS
jgi:hypothetical protein